MTTEFTNQSIKQAFQNAFPNTKFRVFGNKKEINVWAEKSGDFQCLEITFNLPRKRTYIDNCFATAKGQGTGTKVLEVIKEVTKKLGFSAIHLTAVQDGIVFWRKKGFEIKDDFFGYYFDGSDFANEFCEKTDTTTDDWRQKYFSEFIDAMISVFKRDLPPKMSLQYKAYLVV